MTSRAPRIPFSALQIASRDIAVAMELLALGGSVSEARCILQMAIATLNRAYLHLSKVDASTHSLSLLRSSIDTLATVVGRRDVNRARELMEAASVALEPSEPIPNEAKVE